AGVVVHADAKIEESAGNRGQCFKAGLEGGHQQSRGHALSRHIRHSEEVFLVRIFGGPGEDVIIIARDGVSRASGEGNLQTGYLWGSGGQEPFVDIASDFEI